MLGCVVDALGAGGVWKGLVVGKAGGGRTWEAEMLGSVRLPSSY